MNLLTAHFLAAAALAAALPLAGCRVVSSSTTISQSGNHISPNTLAQVQPGASPEYVLTLLGPPSTKTQLESGIEIWRWHHREERTSKGGVLLLFSGTRETTVERSTFVEFADGAVTKAWRD